MRNAIVAGQFYPSNKKDLEKEIKEYSDNRGEDSEIKGAIVPHAGYSFSGKCAGKVYSLIPRADCYVILGANHTGIGRFLISVSLEDFSTPLGIVKNDLKIGKAILKELRIEEDKAPHEYEHSIEVQLPFLQILKREFKICPVIVNFLNLEILKKFSRGISNVVKNSDKRPIFIASSDFNHIGPAYRFFSPKYSDKEAIDAILKLNTDKFLKIAKDSSICGSPGIALLMEIMKLSNCKHAELIDYYSSDEIIQGENKVGYAGVVFK